MIFTLADISTFQRLSFSLSLYCYYSYY